MTMKEFRWLFLVVFAAVFVASIVSEPVTLGASAQWSNGNYRFAGGTHPLALLLATVILGLYVLLMFSPSPILGDPLPGVFRRFVAFWLDFFLALMVIGPTLGILPTLTEWRRTGNFQWNFERTTYAPGDGWLVAAGIVLAAAALILYYAFPLLRGRPSPGTCITGYQIVPDKRATITAKVAVLRTLLGFTALSAWPLAPFIARDRKQGTFWIDRVFHTHAVKLT
jgi:hypothetical protein